MPDDARIERFRRLVEQDPADELANFSLGAALVEAGRFAAAVPHLQKVLAVNPRSSRAWQMLGVAQRGAGDREHAVATLTEGYRVARRQGDMLPLKAIEDLLRELGAPLPAAVPSPAVAAVADHAAAEGGFRCRRCGGGGPPLDRPPFKGELGEKVQAGVCRACWAEWIRMGTRVINELRLSMNDPQAQETYDRHLREFLMLE